MPFADQMLAGLNLLFLGMGTVFFFLIILVFTLRGMSALARALDGAMPETPAAAGPQPAATPTDGHLVAVISAAVARYRANHTHQ